MLLLRLCILAKLAAAMPMSTLAVLDAVPSEPENGGSIADTPINLASLLAMMHILDLFC
jgi:hypothetical protein